MISSSSRSELIERLKYTFITAGYEEIDVLIEALSMKDNFEELCLEFFSGCKIEPDGRITPTGFFYEPGGSASLIYSMYEILARTPDTFKLKYGVRKIKFYKKSLSGNFRIPESIFYLPSLEYLSIRGIGITRMPAKTSAAGNLKVLDLALNKISIFPEGILKLKKLSVLNLSYNRLVSVPEGIKNLSSLEILNLSANNITGLPDGLQKLNNLRIMDVSMNKLEKLPGSLKNISSIREIRAAYNNLTAAEEAEWEKMPRAAAED